MSSSGNQLEGGLKSRHLTMLSIAGVIGGALFVGSGKVIANAGPAAILAYLGGGILVVLVMRMLGEMAVAQPDTGSFSTYADRAIGRWAGFTIGCDLPSFGKHQACYRPHGWHTRSGQTFGGGGLCPHARCLGKSRFHFA